jgi:hypothetical protein
MLRSQIAKKHPPKRFRNKADSCLADIGLIRQEKY